MRSRVVQGIAGGILAIVVATLPACQPVTRYEVLSFFFDGVPPPAPPAAPKTESASGVLPAHFFREHGPYGARLCNACHESTASNSFVAPKDKLCLTCHDSGPAKKLQHDPFASGDCMSCHDPHNSAWQYLLIARPNDVCAGCHETEMLPEDASHRDAAKVCISCHDPHQSDKETLLR